MLPGPLLTVLVFIAVPALFFLVVWALVAFFRLRFPERPRPLPREAVRLNRETTSPGPGVPVRLQEIREDQRRALHEQTTLRYHYASGESEGLPAAWIENLWQRRN